MMAAETASTSLVPIQPVFTDAERLALAGYVAAYRGLTREACTLDLPQSTGWCRARSLPLFSVRRAGIETFAREPGGAAGPGPPSPAACPQSPGSTGTPLRRDSSTTRRAARPAVCREEALPVTASCSVIASMACGTIGVVAAWSR